MWHIDYKNIDATFRRRVLRTSRLCAPNTVYDIEVRLRRTTDAQMPDRAVLGAGDGPGVARRDGPARARSTHDGCPSTLVDGRANSGFDGTPQLHIPQPQARTFELRSLKVRSIT